MARFHPARPSPCARQTRSPARATSPAVGRAACLSPPPTQPLRSRSAGSSGRPHASQTMTSCGQRSLNVLTVLSLLVPAGSAPGVLRGRGRPGGQETLPGPWPAQPGFRVLTGVSTGTPR